MSSLLTDISEEELKQRESRMTIASKIAKALKNQNMFQKSFALLLDKRPSEISKWLSGKHNFTIDTLSDIEGILNIQQLKRNEEFSFESKIGQRLTITVKASDKGTFVSQNKQSSYTYKCDYYTRDLLYNKSYGKEKTSRY